MRAVDGHARRMHGARRRVARLAGGRTGEARHDQFLAASRSVLLTEPADEEFYLGSRIRKADALHPVVLVARYGNQVARVDELVDLGRRDEECEVVGFGRGVLPLYRAGRAVEALGRERRCDEKRRSGGQRPSPHP
jgi:hypothetical protein